MMFERRAAMATLLADRPKNLFVVPGLGSCTWDAFAAGDDDRNFYLWGAMGGAAMIGLGLALAKPNARVAVITGDGEMLMGLGSLATIGVQKPGNLAIVVFDNGLYGETGMQASHTSGGVDLLEVARGCGIERVMDIEDEAGLKELAGLLATCDRTLFARVRITPDDPPRVLPEKDGVLIKDRVRRAALASILRGRCRAGRQRAFRLSQLKPIGAMLGCGHGIRDALCLASYERHLIPGTGCGKQMHLEQRILVTGGAGFLGSLPLRAPARCWEPTSFASIISSAEPAATSSICLIKSASN